MPNRRPHDHIGQLKAAGISEKEIKVIVANMERLVKGGLSLRNLETVAQTIINNSSFKEKFIKDPESTIDKIGNPIAGVM